MSEKLSREQKQIIAELFSSKEQAVLDSIGKIRNNGGAYSIKPLMQVYFSTPFKSVEEAIYELFCDSKDNSISASITEDISKHTEIKSFAKFVSALWQSSIKFDSLLPYISIFDKADDIVAVELFTLIEQNAEHLSMDEKSNCRAFLKAGLSKYSDFKKNLAEEMIKIL
jgi:hypothetical protein